jgi:serine/threonine protein kinase
MLRELFSAVQVFRAYDLKSGSEVALKIHTVDPKVPMGQREYVRRAIREVAILEGLDHPCIVRLHEVFQISDTSLAIVMEACRGVLCRPLLS